MTKEKPSPAFFEKKNNPMKEIVIKNDENINSPPVNPHNTHLEIPNNNEEEKTTKLLF